MKNRLLLLIIFLAQLSAAYAQDQSRQDSITLPIYPKYDSVSNMHRFWLGANNRRLWAVPVRMRHIHFSTEQGGLTIVALGGGMQTRSLRLKDKKGNEWVIRTLQKYPDRKLAENLKKSVAKDILQDQVSAINPFGALVVPVFADALGVHHSSPEIVFVGDDPGLGSYQKDFSNTVYLMERRVPEEDEKSDNTEKVQRKLKEDNDVSVNQHLVLRARLLDMLLGDWDRHEDQWRWGKVKKDGKSVYNPIPRDRDQVFYKTAGIFPWIVSHQWLKSRFQPFDYKLRDVKGWNFGARYFDRYFLNSLDKNDWETEVRAVQQIISDSLINEAIQILPNSIRKLIGTELADKFKTRRNDLMTYAMEYYQFISITVDVPGSEKGEQFDVEAVDPKHLRVTIHDLKKNDSVGDLVYDRTFNADVSKEVRLYGISGKDIFKVKGKDQLPLKVRIVGSDKKDKFIISDEIDSKKNLHVYDNLKHPEAIPDKSKAKIHLSGDSAVNQYDSKTFKYDRTGPAVLANYNIDQGVLLKVGFMDERHGFRKEPYARKQEYWANYSTGRQAFSFTYSGAFIQAIGKNDLLVDANIYGPNNFGNFFGVGNDTEFDQEGDRDITYYRNRFDHAEANVALSRQISPDWRIQYGLATQFYTSKPENNIGRFLTDYANATVADDVFNDFVYAGGAASLVYGNRDRASLSAKGLYWRTDVSINQGIVGTSRYYSKISTEFDAYIGIKDSSIVLANRIGGGLVLGNPLFFQHMNLGGANTLRGFHTNRFTGRQMAYYNLELRAKLFDFNAYILPGSFGVVGFNDIGRVWERNESSNTWHHGYGGGIFINPANLLTIQALVGFSKENTIPYITLGFQF